MARLLSQTDKKQIEKIIGEVEKHTAGEIVVMVTAKSAPYDDWRALLSGILTIGTALLVYLFIPAIPGVWVIAGQVPVAALFFWLSGMSPILRTIVPKEDKAQAVSARAHQLFIEQGLTETRDRSGVLLLVSELEHRVEILADQGIHRVVGIEGWRSHVDHVINAIHSGRTAEGLCRVIQDIGQQLAQAFPVRPDDINELSNKVVRAD